MTPLNRTTLQHAGSCQLCQLCISVLSGEFFNNESVIYSARLGAIGPASGFIKLSP